MEKFGEMVCQILGKYGVVDGMIRSEKESTSQDLAATAGACCVSAYDVIPYEIEAMKAVVREKIILFGSSGMA